jgi:Flp pilus assembly protein TadG
MRSHLKGQTYAEFALCAVVVLILIFGVVNFSLVVYAYNFVSYAAREGARFAAVHGSSNPPPAHSADITNLISAEGYGLNGGNLKVSTTWSPNNQPGSVGRGAGSIYFQLHDSVRYTTASESNQQPPAVCQRCCCTSRMRKNDEFSARHYIAE